MQVTQANFPNTIHIGDVCNIKAEDYPNIDLILAGSPCQGFSFAGKQLAFDDPRSALFFEFVRLLKEIKPKYFLLENVRMKQQFQDVITEQVSACYPDFEGGDLFGSQIKPILINSALLSAQNRQRLYWTNIPNIEQPEDKGIVLRDILEDQISKEFYYKEKSIAYMERGSDKWAQAKSGRRADGYEQTSDKEKSFTITANWHKGVPYNYFKETKPKQVGKIKDGGQGNRIYSQDGKSSSLSAQSGGTAGVGNTLVETKPKQVGIATDIKGHDILKRVYSPDGKSPTLNTMGGGNREPKVVSGAWRGRYKEDGTTEQKLELNQSGKSNSLTTVQKDSVVVSTKPNQINPSKKAGGKQPYMQDRVFHKKGKSHALTESFASRTHVGEENNLSWRKLTPLECERLQTVPDNYTNHVSNTQRYKMLGNGWTVEVIAHILNNMEL